MGCRSSAVFLLLHHGNVSLVREIAGDGARRYAAIGDTGGSCLPAAVAPFRLFQSAAILVDSAFLFSSCGHHTIQSGEL